MDHVRKLSSSQESLGLLSTLLFDTYSLADANMLVEKLFNSDAIIASSISKSGTSVRPTVDRDVISSSIDFAISTPLVQNIVI